MGIPSSPINPHAEQEQKGYDEKNPTEELAVVLERKGTLSQNGMCVPDATSSLKVRLNRPRQVCLAWIGADESCLYARVWVWLWLGGTWGWANSDCEKNTLLRRSSYHPPGNTLSYVQ